MKEDMTFGFETSRFGHLSPSSGLLLHKKDQIYEDLNLFEFVVVFLQRGKWSSGFLFIKEYLILNFIFYHMNVIFNNFFYTKKIGQFNKLKQEILTYKFLKTWDSSVEL